MKLKFINVICSILLHAFAISAYASASPSKNIMVDFQQVAISDALHILADKMHQNILINGQVSGFVTLHLEKYTAQEVFDLILQSHNLVRMQQGNSWLVVPRDNEIFQKQNEQKLQEALSAASPLVLRIWKMHYARAEDIVKMIQNNQGSLLTKRGFVYSDMRTNALCVQDTEESLAKIGKIIQQLDVPVHQVLIEARLASVDSDYERELGIHFAVRSPEEAAPALNAGDDMATPFSFTIAHLANGARLDMKLSALEREGHGELISSPRLFTANQQTASIESGEEIPYQEISRSGATGIAFKKAVLSLKVTPQILPHHKVLLQLQVNQDQPSNRQILGVPAITTRQISTNVLAEDGQTIVLGGIYEAVQDKSIQGIPFLDKIPLVGIWFQTRNDRQDKRELLIFVTPHIT